MSHPAQSVTMHVFASHQDGQLPPVIAAASVAERAASTHRSHLLQSERSHVSRLHHPSQPATALGTFAHPGTSAGSQPAQSDTPHVFLLHQTAHGMRVVSFAGGGIS